MDIDSLHDAAKLYEQLCTLNRAKVSIVEMSRDENWSEDSLVFRDKGSQIELNLTGAVQRNEFLELIDSLLNSKLDNIERMAAQLS